MQKVSVLPAFSLCNLLHNPKILQEVFFDFKIYMGIEFCELIDFAAI